MKLNDITIEYSDNTFNLPKEISENLHIDKSFEKSIINSEVINSDIIEPLSKEQMDKKLLIADIQDEMTAIEHNQKLPDEQRISTELLISLATENIIETSNSDQERLKIAIDTIFDSMEANPANANEIKQGVIALLKEEF